MSLDDDGPDADGLMDQDGNPKQASGSGAGHESGVRAKGGKKVTHEMVLKAYQQMGLKRSLRDLSESTGVSLLRLRKWQHKHAWVEKCRIYDQEMADSVDTATREAIVTRAIDWAKRDESVRHRLYESAEALIEKAGKMLAFPLERVQYETDIDGKKTAVHVHPAKWNFGTAAKMIEAAATLQRKAGQVAEVNKRLYIPGSTDPDALPDAQSQDGHPDPKTAISEIDTLISRLKGMLPAGAGSQVIDAELLGDGSDDSDDDDQDA